MTEDYDLSGYPMKALADRIEQANDVCDALTLTRNGREIGVVVSVEEWARLTAHDSPPPPPPAAVMVFVGGPWDGKSHTGRVTAPVFAVGDEVGNHYWLDTKSDPPTYHWDGTEWEVK